MRDHAHDEIVCAQPLERVDDLIEGLGVECPEPLVDENGLKLGSKSLGREISDVTREREREREAREERLAAAKRLYAALLISVRVVDNLEVAFYRD